MIKMRDYHMQLLTNLLKSILFKTEQNLEAPLKLRKSVISLPQQQHSTLKRKSDYVGLRTFTISHLMDCLPLPRQFSPVWEQKLNSLVHAYLSSQTIPLSPYLHLAKSWQTTQQSEQESVLTLAVFARWVPRLEEEKLSTLDTYHFSRSGSPTYAAAPRVVFEMRQQPLTSQFGIINSTILLC